MRVLNLYAGLGGNRKLWTDVDVTAVELNEKVAGIYQDFYPNDKVIIADAHQYLLNHYQDFDFIWSSPPCPTHSTTNFFLNPQGIVRYPDMALYQEIILLTHFCKGKFCIENVKSYYDPLIKPQESGRHYFWANFRIPKVKSEMQIGRMNGTKATMGTTTHILRANNHKILDIDLSPYKGIDKEKLLNNCVVPELGRIIFEAMIGQAYVPKQEKLPLF